MNEEGVKYTSQVLSVFKCPDNIGLIALGNGMNPDRPLNGCKIDVRFWFIQYIKAVTC